MITLSIILYVVLTVFLVFVAALGAVHFIVKLREAGFL